MTATTQPGTISADEAFGRVVWLAMFDRKITQKRMATALGIEQSTMSRKLRGKAAWSLEDSIKVADELRMDYRDLVSAMWDDPRAPQAGQLCARQDSNLQPLDPTVDARSNVIELDWFRTRAS